MSDDESDIPSRAVCEERIDQFVQVTNTNEALAQMMLQDNDWTLETAIAKYFEENGGPEVPAGSGSSKPAPSLAPEILDRVTTRAPEKLTVVTWNVDGLDEKSLKARCKTIARLIDEHAVDVAMLQEVIPSTLEFFREALPHYQIVCESPTADYFVATLLRRFTVYLDDFAQDEFPGSRMGRGLLITNCHVGRAQFCFLNTHLESTKDFSDERMVQLMTCFKKAGQVDPTQTVIFGGDLNLRDFELAKIGGIPPGMDDLWLHTGSRKECQYTFDLTKNTNKELPGKVRCRFDRIYLKNANPRRVKTDYFGFVGIEKVPGCQRFPSDHWGIRCIFKVKSND